VPSIVIKHPDGSSHEHVVSEQLTVGRSEGNDLVLTEGGVSRKHARFFVEGGAILVEDIGSANGTWVDGNRIDSPTRLAAASQVVIGDYEIAVKDGGARRATGQRPQRPSGGSPRPGGAPVPRSTRVVPATKRPAGGAGLARRPARPAGGRTPGGNAPVLRGLSGVANGKTFPLSGTMLVGRVAGVDIQIEDDSVSRKHAEVEARGRRVVVRDLGSANGTTVNGEPLEGDVELADGDILQFGVVEVAFETGGAGAGAIARPGGAPVRPSRAAAPPSYDSRSSASFEDDEPGMPPQRKRLFIIGGGVLGLLFVVVLIKAVMGPGPVGPPPDRPLGGGLGQRPQAGGPQIPSDPAAQIEELLVRCRTYASAEYGKPDWGKAEAACTKALDLDPINADANELLRKIKVEKACEENLTKARELAGYNRFEESIDYFGKIDESCPSFFLKAMADAKPVVAAVRKAVGKDCQTYARSSKWEQALKSCELYSRLACQTMKDDQLYPPALTQLKLEGPLRKGDWRPKDPLYLDFLRARAKLKPDEPAWRCPEIKVLRPPPPPPDPNAAADAFFKKRLPDPEMARSLSMYFRGNFGECRVPLQKITEQVSKAKLHGVAKDLFRDMSLAIDLYQSGTSDMTNDKLDRAASAYHKALNVDETLVLGKAEAAKMAAEDKRLALERYASFIRRAIIDSMTNNAYNKGKDYADRKDFRQACRTWKVGLEFSRGNVDLIKAAAFCTTKAKATLDNAENCEVLKSVLDFAVDGDGYKEQVEKYLTQYNCH